MGKVKGWKTL